MGKVKGFSASSFFEMLRTLFLFIILNKTISCIWYFIGIFMYPLKASENLSFSNVFRGYRKRPVG